MSLALLGKLPQKLVSCPVNSFFLPCEFLFSSVSFKSTIIVNTGELGYDRPLYDGFLHMTNNMLGPSPMHIKYSSYVYDGPIFLVPLSPSYPSSPVITLVKGTHGRDGLRD